MPSTHWLGRAPFNAGFLGREIGDLFRRAEDRERV